MPAGYSDRVGKPVGCSDRAFGGAGLNLGLEALIGEGDMITAFDDFNGWVKSEGFGASTYWENLGWVLSDVNVPAQDSVLMNDPGNTVGDSNSCIRVHPGITDDRGGNMQLDVVNASYPTSVGHVFNHIWIPAASDRLGTRDGRPCDDTSFLFACRIGIRAANFSGSVDGDWDSKFFIGWAADGDTSIMDEGTGAITIPSTNPLAGFHVLEDGSIRGISHRTVGDAMTEGTNFTELIPAGGVDGTVVNGAVSAGDTMWFDLAMRIEFNDFSDDADNGYTKFYYRGPLNHGAPKSPGRDVLDEPAKGHFPWRAHPTALINNNLGVIGSNRAYVPTIEMINGPTAGTDGFVFIDWWAMGRSRETR